MRLCTPLRRTTTNRKHTVLRKSIPKFNDRALRSAMKSPTAD